MDRPLRLLALDGGGVRGYSEIIMIEAIMKRVKKLLDLDAMPIPAEYFDLIGGTSTGGLIAIMLGRLRMSTRETILAYEMLSQRIFGKKAVWSKLHKKGRFDPELFASVIQAVVLEKEDNIHAKLIDDRPGACKIFVTTVCTEDVPHIRMLRSYDTEYNLEHDCEIWEAARATSAAPTYFAPIDIGPPGQKLRFVDGGLGCNNPTYQLVLEAERLFKSSRKVACVVSLGTGQKKINEITEPTFVDDYVAPVNLISSIKNLATDCERIAEIMEVTYHGMKDVYFRLNVEHGLQGIKLADWEQLHAVRAHTMSYLELPGVAERLDSIAALLAGTDTQRKTYQLGLLSLSNDVVIATATGLPLDKTVINAEDRKSSFYDWFSSQNRAVNHMRDQKDNYAKRFVDDLSGHRTCSWFFDTPEFLEFQFSKNPVALWVRGFPGCGKSVLTSAVVSHLATLEKPNRTLFYFCRQDPVQTSFRDILCSFLAQATLWGGEEIPRMMQDFRALHPSLDEPDKEVDLILLQLLLMIISSISSQRLYIVIDSIDACEARHRPIPLLIRLICRVEGTPKPSLIFTSRAAPDSSIISFPKRKHNFRLMHLEISPEKTTPDLKAMVKCRVDDSEGPLGSKPQDQRDSIIDTITGRVRGMFLHATLLLDLLKGDRVASRSAIRATLEDLPEDIFLTYQQQFEIIKNKRKAPEVFWWIYAAMRDLTWDEVRAGIATIDGVYDEDERIEQPAEDFIRESCSALVELCGERNGNLRFIHQTVQEVLSQPNGPGQLIQIQSAHSAIAAKLLAMLMSAEVPDFNLSTEDPSRMIENYVNIPGHELYQYAVLNWYKHLKTCQNMTDQLQESVATFLSSSHSLKWLATAWQCAQAASSDLFTLARDVTDCLWSWMRTHQDTLREDVRAQVSSWSEHFLNLVLDWGNALQNQPRYLTSLHFDLLPKKSPFRKFVGEQTYQSVVRFSHDTIRTRSSMPPLWTNYVFAVDEDRDWAYAYLSGYLQCYHTKTGLLVAELYLGRKGFQQAILSPNKGFIALSFATHEVPDRQVARYISKINQGLHLTTFATAGFKEGFSVTWCLESSEFDLTKIIFGRFVGAWIELDHTSCLVRLDYEGLARTNLFGLVPGMSSFNVASWKAPASWKVDEPSLLGFSSDSKYLSTPCGRTQLADGISTAPWPVIQHSPVAEAAIRSTFVSADFGTLATIRDRAYLDLWDVKSRTAKSTRLEGVGHILAISSHARFILLLIVEASVKPATSELSLDNLSFLFRPSLQKGTVTIYDAQLETWTDLATLKPPTSKKRRPWAFQDSPCKAAFGPEGTGVDKLMVYVPAKWEIAEGVHLGTRIFEPNALETGGHLLIFHSNPQSSGFGANPILRHMIPLEPLKRSSRPGTRSCSSDRDPDETGSMADNFRYPVVISWDESLEHATVYFKGEVSKITAHDLQTLVVSERRRQSTLKQHGGERTESVVAAGVFKSGGRGVIYRLRIFQQIEDSNTSKQSTSAKPIYRYHVLVERLGVNDNRPATYTMNDAFPPSHEPISPSSLNDVVVNADRILLRDHIMQLSLIEGSLTATCQETGVLRTALEAFSRASRPFQASKTRAFMSSFLASSADSRYAIFENTYPAFESKVLESRGRVVVNKSNARQSAFTPIITHTNRENLYFCQFSRAFDPGEVITGQRREARSFEVYLSIYDHNKREMTWMIHTTTGGDMDDSERSIPKVHWALHPTQPLLVWNLPGHKPKISRLDSHVQPINIAEPIALEADAAQALLFSPNGRYLLIRGADILCNVFVRERPDAKKITIGVFDWVTGFRTTLLFTSSTKVSVDIDDDCVRIYRVSREDAVEMNVLNLPNLMGIERFNLTYIPADCCCPTCDTTFQKDCNVSVQHRNHSTNVILSHSPVHIGRGPLTSQACEPLILRTGRPTRSIDVAANDSFIPEKRIGLCPIVLSEDGRLDAKVFQIDFQPEPENKSAIKHLTLDEAVKEATKNLKGSLTEEDMAKAQTVQQLALGVYQVASTSDKLTLANQELVTRLGSDLQKARRGMVRQPIPQIVNFQDLMHDKLLTSEDIESTVQRRENLATAALVHTSAKDWGERSFAYISGTKAGKTLPFENWAEMKEAFEAMEDNQKVRSMFDGIFPPGDSSIGTRIPILLHTFLPAGQGVDLNGRATPHLQWSCAMDIGWIEENISWLYTRVFRDQFEDARSWYVWPAMQREGHRFEKLLVENTPEGERVRQSMSPFFNRHALPAIEGKDDSDRGERKKRAQDWRERLDPDMLDPEEYIASWSESFQALSSVSPGLGEFLSMRLKSLIHTSLEDGIEDEDFFAKQLEN